MNKKLIEQIDVAIVGGGPAGMQAALVLSRTRKKIIVFDAPSPPRNAASHGVHNFLGLDGLLPTEIREQAWQQIDVYGQAKLRQEWVTDITIDQDKQFLVTTKDGKVIRAKKVILALGYRDIHPQIDGFSEAWANTIFPCPFCDGYENRDRTWAIVADHEMQATHFPKMIQNWTNRSKLILNNVKIKLEPIFEQELTALGIPIYRGNIMLIEQTAGKVKAVHLDSGERIEAETLLWTPPLEQSDLVKKLVEKFDLDVNEMGHLQTNDHFETKVSGLFAAGDVRGWTGAIESAVDGGTAAAMIVHGWYS